MLSHFSSYLIIKKGSSFGLSKSIHFICLSIELGTEKNILSHFQLVFAGALTSDVYKRLKPKKAWKLVLVFFNISTVQTCFQTFPSSDKLNQMANSKLELLPTMREKFPIDLFSQIFSLFVCASSASLILLFFLSCHYNNNLCEDNYTLTEAAAVVVKK